MTDLAAAVGMLSAALLFRYLDDIWFAGAVDPQIVALIGLLVASHSLKRNKKKDRNETTTSINFIENVIDE